jgi:hypothetical protein
MEQWRFQIFVSREEREGAVGAGSMILTPAIFYDAAYKETRASAQSARNTSSSGVNAFARSLSTSIQLHAPCRLVRQAMR